MFPRMPLVTLTLVTLLSACADRQPQPEPIRQLRTMKVGEVADLVNAQLPGRARAADSVDLSFDVSGTLIERPVSIGTQVKEGDLIARLDPADFQANVRAAEADARTAARNFERGSELIEKDFISKAEYDRLEARVDITEAQLALARQALSDSVIQAPFDGVISNLSVENFQSVRAKEDIARLLGTERIEMVINVSESQIANIHRVEKLEVEFDAFPGLRLPAEITEVGTEASQTTRTFPITLEMKQPDDNKIRAGMAGIAFASGRLQTESEVNYVVPVSALFGNAQSNQNKVWIVNDDNTVGSRDVVVGGVTEGGVTIESGLTAGEVIATAGVHTLAEGQEVIVNRGGE